MAYERRASSVTGVSGPAPTDVAKERISGENGGEDHPDFQNLSAVTSQANPCRNKAGGIASSTMHSTEISTRATAPSGGGVFFPKGLVIGYRPRLRPQVHVAAFESEIFLGPGHHLLLARNGSGKTTLLRTLGGLITPLEEAVRIDGGLLHFCDDLTFDGGQKPREILRALLDRDAFKTSLSFAGELELPLDRDYATLSRGNRQKIVAVLGEAAAAHRKGGCVLLFDEPLSGLDFVARDIVRSWWRERRTGVCRIVSHHPDDATLEADAALVIRENTVGLVKPEDGILDWSGLRHSLFAPRSEV